MLDILDRLSNVFWLSITYELNRVDERLGMPQFVHCQEALEFTINTGVAINTLEFTINTGVAIITCAYSLRDTIWSSHHMQ